MRKNISKASSLVRGGQTTQHWWRMGLQVFRFATVMGAFVYMGTFAVLITKDHNWDEMRIAFYYELADIGIVTGNGFGARDYSFNNLQGNHVTLSASQLYGTSQYRKIRDSFFERLHWASRISIWPAAVMTLLSLGIFKVTGDRVQDDEHIRGTDLIARKSLLDWSNARWKNYRKHFKGRKKAPIYTIAGIPFPPNALEAQTGIFGTVGVGKTNALLELLSTVRKLGGRAVVYDRMGTFVEKYYNSETDIIINPFDSRSHCWCLFDDVYDLASFTQIAEVMIPTNADSSGDQFWSQSARIVFEYVARQLYEHGPRTNEALKQAILNLPSDELSSLISSTPGAHFFHESIEKTSQSIRANLIAELRLLEFLRSDGPRFSIREWMKSDEPSFLFLTGDAEHAAATRNLTSVLLEVGANAMMSGPKSSDPTVFFFMDEVPTLNRLPFLVKSLAEIRQFGGAFVLGYQVYSQLEDIYGREAAQTINGTINNRIVFNTPDFRTAKIFSESLGSQDMLEKRANISVGAHEARDGVGFMQNRVERQIVMPAEIQSLPQFSAYIRFAYDAPTALVEFEPFDVEDVSPGFLTYLGDGFSGSSAVLAPPDEADAQSPKNQKPSKKLFEEFVVWAKQNMNAADGEWMKGKSSPPDNIAACWAFFAKQRHDGVQPDNIIPFVNTTSDMMDRRGGSGRDNTPVGAPHPAPWEMDQSPPGTMPSVSHDRQQHINSAKIDTKVRVSKPEPKPSSEIESAVVWISTDELGTF